MTDEKVENFLAHYASKYYDPVKAKEYYERTKELVGRDSASPEQPTSGTGTVSKLTVGAKAQGALSSLASRSGSSVQPQVQAQLQSAVKDPVAAHNERMEKLAKDTEELRDKIVDKLKSEVERIRTQLKIPANASPKLRAYLEKQQRSQTKTAVGSAQKDMNKLKSDVKAAVAKAKEDYKAIQAQAAAERKAQAEQNRLNNMAVLRGEVR